VGWVLEERNAAHEAVSAMMGRGLMVVQVRGARISCSRRVSLPVYVFTHVHPVAAVEYIQQLLAERQHFTERLQRARAVLPPGHPVLGLSGPPGDLPLWEREWTGGLDAKDDDDAGDASGDDDEP
jgi:hypothetical protein